MATELPDTRVPPVFAMISSPWKVYCAAVSLEYSVILPLAVLLHTGKIESYEVPYFAGQMS